MDKENRMSLRDDNKSRGMKNSLIVDVLINAVDGEIPIFVVRENSEAETVYETKGTEFVFSSRFERRDLTKQVVKI